MEHKKLQVEPVRVDKWLWAARFFKTRSQAAQAVAGGHVHVNGQRVKPARNIVVGDKMVISLGGVEFHILVTGLSEYRRPAVEARLLYLESEESVAAREELRQLRKMSVAGYAAPAGRPSKRDRRKIRSFTRKQ